MPFDEFFAEQLELVKDFVVTPDAAVNIIEVDGEMQGHPDADAGGPR